MPYLKPEIPFTNHHFGYPGIHVNFQGSGLPYSKKLAVGFGWFVGWKASKLPRNSKFMCTEPGRYDECNEHIENEHKVTKLFHAVVVYTVRMFSKMPNMHMIIFTSVDTYGCECRYCAYIV